MKKSPYINLIFILFLYSCNREKDVSPTKDTRLKGFLSEITSNSSRIRRHHLFGYSNGMYSFQRVDSVEQGGIVRKMSPTWNGVFSEEFLNNFKLIEELHFYVESKFNVGVNYTNKVETIVKKVNDNFELITSYDSKPYVYASVELNNSNQMLKYNTSSVATVGSSDGIKDVIFYDGYYRFEYDINGNVSKVFYSANGTSETLFAKYTYDTNPNPFINLKWLCRLSIIGTKGVDIDLAASESNNNILTVKYYRNGELAYEKTNSYKYDIKTNLPTEIVSTMSKTDDFSNIYTYTLRNIFTY